MMQDQIDSSNFEVVRNELLQVPDVPQLSFSKGRFHVNKFCLRQFPEIDYVQILVDQEQKVVLLRPEEHRVRDSVRWVIRNKRIQRQIKADPFYYLIFKMMNWNYGLRYRIDGRIIKNQENSLLYFPLLDAVSFEYNEDDEKRLIQRVPEIWKDRFGMTKKAYDEAEFVKTYEEDALFEIELPFRKDLVPKVKQTDNVQEIKTNE